MQEEEPGEEAIVTGRLIQVAKSAYQYPLILKQLWHAPIVQAADQEIVYRDLKRFTYRDIRERIGRLASALHGIGIRPGETVGVLDWDRVISKYGIPEKILFVEKLAKTSVGKINKKELREKYGAM